MSPVPEYYDWDNRGRPWTAAKPIEHLAATLRQVGYTVYIIGNDDHLMANPPEDHTPFSYTGWPSANPKDRVLALDIMPKPGLPTLQTLAHALIAAKEADFAPARFIKYMNWTDEQGAIHHTSWQGDEVTRVSTDGGHIHLSARTDFVDSVLTQGWNPLENVPNPPAPPVQPAPPAPPAPVGRPAPGPAVSFPLPAGYYFGPKDGPAQSVSGYYNRVFNGKTDRQWLEEWSNQLSRRGWDIGMAHTYLRNYGNNGLYGVEYKTLIEAFQGNQHLHVDGQLGPITWNAAYHNPVT